MLVVMRHLTSPRSLKPLLLRSLGILERLFDVQEYMHTINTCSCYLDAFVFEDNVILSNILLLLQDSSDVEVELHCIKALNMLFTRCNEY
jgi:hypothetical protein